MRPTVEALVVLGRLPSEDVEDESLWESWQRAVDAVQKSWHQDVEQPATDDEARAALAVLPLGDDSSYGLAWTLLHFIESAPGWPMWSEVDGPDPWMTILRERAARGVQSEVGEDRSSR